MKIDETVKKETRYILLGQVILLALMIAIYLIIGNFSLLVLLGGLSASILAVCNFFLMGLAIQKSLDAPEDNRAKIIRTSQTTRHMVMALIVVVCLAIPKFDPIATLIPLFFPRLTITVRQIAISRSEK